MTLVRHMSSVVFEHVHTILQIVCIARWYRIPSRDFDFKSLIHLHPHRVFHNPDTTYLQGAPRSKISNVYCNETNHKYFSTAYPMDISLYSIYMYRVSGPCRENCSPRPQLYLYVHTIAFEHTYNCSNFACTPAMVMEMLWSAAVMRPQILTKQTSAGREVAVDWLRTLGVKNFSDVFEYFLKSAI